MLTLVGGGELSAVFPVTIDYGITLQAMIAAGRYDWTNSDVIAEHFPSPKAAGKVDADLQLAHFNRITGSHEALRRLDRRGYRASTIEELLAFGATYPEEQLKHSIVALGAFWQRLFSNHHVAYLCKRDPGRRCLDLEEFEGGWAESCRFLGIRKERDHTSLEEA